MEDQPGLSDHYRKASPWPLFVALGLALSEVGVVMGLLPLAVGGLLLLVGSVAGIVDEAGYVDSPWALLIGMGLILVATGAALVVFYGGRTGDRGLAIAIAGVLSVIAGLGGRFRVNDFF